ncbi:MAG: hypothetical protein ABI164_10035 [Acidobacteriaceae bacterium]
MPNPLFVFAFHQLDGILIENEEIQRRLGNMMLAVALEPKDSPAGYLHVIANDGGVYLQFVRKQ